jgi:hypothetical protein
MTVFDMARDRSDLGPGSGVAGAPGNLLGADRLRSGFRMADGLRRGLQLD